MMKVLLATALAVMISGYAETAQSAVSGDFGPETLTLINSYRTSRGLSRLAENRTVKALALQHSREQAAHGSMNHDGFRQRLAQAKAAGLTGVCSENVGFGHQSAQQLFSRWRISPGHNANMLQPNMRYGAVVVVGGYSTFFVCR